MKHAHIVGWGSFLPDRVLSNDDIAQIVDTSDEWIVERVLAGGVEPELREAGDVL